MFIHITQSFRKTFSIRASEWALGAMLALWAVVLQSYPTLMERSPNMAPLLDQMSQPLWMALCLVVGMGRLTILAVNGGWRRTPHARALAAFASCFFWFQVSVGLLHAENGTTGLAIYPVLLALDVYHVFRAIDEAGRSDANFARERENGANV